MRSASRAKSGDARLETHALIDGLLLQTLTDPEFRGDELLDSARNAIERLGALGDEVGLAKAWRAVAEVELTRCRWGASAAALEQAIVHGRRAGRQPAETYANLATALYYGPTPVDECDVALSRASRRGRRQAHRGGGGHVLPGRLPGDAG